MRVKKMRLENFSGIRELELDFNCTNADLYGANASGKSTICNAFTWLMFGKSYEDDKSYTPKSISGGEEAHHLDHSAECEIEIDGEVVAFRKVYHEIYKKSRGKSEEVFSGHTTDYYINGVPKSEKEYLRYWESVFENAEIPKLLSKPFYFAETLHWEKRRGILLDICGNIADSVIMETDAELKALPALVGKLSVDEYKKTVKATITDINRNLQTLPARIDEARKAIPDTSAYTKDGIE
jgi:AAA15 family ATPase/GTPase